jgi:hypothetical protein
MKSCVCLKVTDIKVNAVVERMLQVQEIACG